jgi:hypothetical protein
VLSGRGLDIVRRGFLMAVAIVAGVLGLPSAALADFTWSGASATPNWSVVTNWAGGIAPSGSAGMLSFPALSAPACTTCYQSSNDVASLSASAISIDDGVPYQITGNGLTLVGAGGITAAPSASDTGASANIALPLALGAAQTWSITGGSSSQQLGVGTVTGSADALTVNFTSSGILSVNDAEVGPVSLNGSGLVGVFGSLNGTDGSPVSITSPARLDASVAGATSGPLTSSGGSIQVGLGHPLDGTLAVTGDVTLDSTSSLTMFIDQSGTTASTDYSKLTASGTVNLGGASLSLDGPATGCPALGVGDVYTLVSATGSLTGRFANAPDNSTRSLICTGGTAPMVKINYTANSVTATVLSTGPGGTTTTLSHSPSSAMTNQPVALTATVGPNSPTPSGGTVAFYDNGFPISACMSQPVNGSTFTATCQTSFAAASSPHSLVAIFTPPSSVLQSSTSPVDNLVVSKDSTTTTLYVSSASPTVGAGVTYVASVAPADSGPTQPSGSVQFLDNGTPIPDCAGQGTVVSELASCVLSYSAAGSHSITASYSGDGSFTGSTSSAQAVTAEPPPPGYGGAVPSISGNTTQGQMLAETHGLWTNSPTVFAYQWQDCDSVGNNCTSIPGATSQTYTLTTSDVGHTIRVLEGAGNAGGSGGPVSSAVTGVVAPPSSPPTVPVSSSPPVVTGPSAVGRTLSTTNGLWSGTPPSGYSYQWQRCSSTGCTNIANATASTYTLTSSDLGMKVRVVVVAVNSVGIGVGVSNKVGPVVGLAQIKALIAKDLKPKGRLAKIGAILKAGGYELSFAAPESGAVVINWYLVPNGAHLAKAQPVLVASGRATFRSAGTKTLKIKLTAYGKGLLRHASRVKLTAQGTFTPSGQAKIVARATFTLTR